MHFRRVDHVEYEILFDYMIKVIKHNPYILQRMEKYQRKIIPDNDSIFIQKLYSFIKHSYKQPDLVDLLKLSDLENIESSNANFCDLICKKINFDMELFAERDKYNLFEPFTSQTHDNTYVLESRLFFENNLVSLIDITGISFVNVPTSIYVFTLVGSFNQNLTLSKIFKTQLIYDENVYNFSGAFISESKFACTWDYLYYDEIKNSFQIHLYRKVNPKKLVVSEILELYSNYFIHLSWFDKNISIKDDDSDERIAEDLIETEIIVKITVLDVCGNLLRDPIERYFLDSKTAKQFVNNTIAQIDESVLLRFSKKITYKLEHLDKTYVTYPQITKRTEDTMLDVIINVSKLCDGFQISDSEITVLFLGQKKAHQNKISKEQSIDDLFELAHRIIGETQLYISSGLHYFKLTSSYNMKISDLLAPNHNKLRLLYSDDTPRTFGIEQDINIPIMLCYPTLKEVSYFKYTPLVTTKVSILLEKVRKSLRNKDIEIFEIVQKPMFLVDDSYLFHYRMNRLAFVEKKESDNVCFCWRYDPIYVFFTESDVNDESAIKDSIRQKLILGDQEIEVNIDSDHLLVEYALLVDPGMSSGYAAKLWRSQCELTFDGATYDTPLMITNDGTIQFMTVLIAPKNYIPFGEMHHHVVNGIPRSRPNQNDVVPEIIQELRFADKMEAIVHFKNEAQTLINAYYYSESAKRSIVRLVKKYPQVPNSQAAEYFGIVSNTLTAWKNGKEISKMGRPRMMSNDNIESFKQQCITLRKELKPVKLKTGREIIKGLKIVDPKLDGEFWDPSLSTVKRVFDLIGWKRKIVQPRSPLSEPENKEEIIQLFLGKMKEIISDSRITVSKLWIMDESAIYSNSVTQYTYCEKGDHDAYVLTGKNKNRDTVAITLRADGMGDLMFLPHKNAKASYNKMHYSKVEDAANSGMSAEALLKWAMHFIKFAQKDDVLIWDNLSCHYDPIVLAVLTTHGINVQFIPARCADRLSVLDFLWFAVFKRELSNHTYDTLEQKINLTMKVFHQLLGSMVIAFFLKIGYSSMAQ